MQKVYLLLRNNQQTGPYDLEELMQLNLKPFDLVWVQGRSAAWQYPGEIPILKDYVPGTPEPDVPYKPITTALMEQNYAQPAKKTIQDNVNTQAKKVFVSMPRKSQPMMQATPSCVPEPDPLPEGKKDPVPPSYRYGIPEPVTRSIPAPSQPPAKEMYSEPVYPRHSRKKAAFSGKDLIITTLILGVIAGGYYILTMPAASVRNRTAPQTQPEQTAKHPVPSIPQVNNAPLPQVNEQASPVSEGEQTGTAAQIKSSRMETKHAGPNSFPEQKASAPATQQAGEDKTAQVNKKPQEEMKESAPPAVEEKVATNKKKKLGEVLKDLFGKQKGKQKEIKEEPKTAPVVFEEPRPATNRQAVHRDDQNQLPREEPKPASREESGTASLADLVDLSSNAPSSWMMGVTGLKITLRNRSHVTIQTAGVNVLYYDENNQVVAKKMVYFNHVAPGGKLTLAAPDHKWADHVDFKLEAVSAKDERYARD